MTDTEFTFKEPRLLLTAPGEFLVRLVTTSSYVLIAGVAALLLESGTSLMWAGLLLVLFLGDRLLHVGEGEQTMQELGFGHKNIADGLTSASYRAVSRSYRTARATGQPFHLLLLRELLERKDVREALVRLDVKPEDFAAKAREALQSAPAASVPSAELRESVAALALKAYAHALDANERFIEPRNFFAALALSGDSAVTRLFTLFDLSAQDVGEAAVFGKWRGMLGASRRLPAVLGGFAHQPRFLRHRVMNRAWTARPTPTLDRYATDLTDLAREEQVGFLIGHEKEFQALLTVIARPGKPNALLIGDPGVGKSTIIAHLAFRMVKDQVPPVLFDKRLVSLDLSSFVAETAPEALSGRLTKIAGEIVAAGNIVLFIPNIHDLFRTGGAKGMQAIDFLLPVVRDAAIPVIGESYPKEFKQFIAQRTDFLDQFDVVEVDEITESEAVRFLTYSALLLEREYRVTVSFRAIRRAVSLAHRYFTTKPLPGSAVDLMKQALAMAAQGKERVLSEDMVIKVAERQSKIPIQTAGGKEAEKLLNLEAVIHEKLVNQTAAVKAVSQALREYRSGLSRRGGPIATFLFVGPTGVGKTELAKILTAIQFGSKDLMHRLDMSEYQEKSSIMNLLGTPDGEKSGALTDAVLKSPYSLVLLDEFEKAHPDILNLFLQVFDDGRLTDSMGRTVSFENTIIIATSNAHSDFIKEQVEAGRTVEDLSDELKRKLVTYFKPELINRFSNIIVFRSLTLDEIRVVTRFQVAEVAAALLEAQGVGLEADDTALARLAELGYSPVFGARPLRQVISEQVRGVLAEKVLRKEIARGNRLLLTFQNGAFEFRVVA